MTDAIFLNHTKHSRQRISERKIDEHLVRKCLKYGTKSETKDGKVKFTLGDLKVVKAAQGVDSQIITTWKTFSGLEGESYIGIVKE